MYEKNECRESEEVSTKGAGSDVVQQEVEKVLTKLVMNENGSVNGEIELLLLPECGER